MISKTAKNPLFSNQDYSDWRY